ncbi:hypothetical protein [Streptomyces sp. NPDC056160]|uniref:hypothetical protein n=1 Tax=Streptomyces sp. NPDC056160 TaxID=3345731 RepID=UPI0035D86A06
MPHPQLHLVLGELRVHIGEERPSVLGRLEPPEPPVPLELAVDQKEGRGLALVEACSDLWGWQPLARNGNRGKVVRCELAAAGSELATSTSAIS